MRQPAAATAAATPHRRGWDHVGGVLGQAPRDGHHLLGRLTLTEDRLDRGVAKSAVLIDLGEAESS